jgi:hypothetical protein
MMELFLRIPDFECKFLQIRDVFPFWIVVDNRTKKAIIAGTG